jgi:hypothetical protein
MAKPIAGSLSFTIDGVPYSTTGSFVISPSNTSNEALVDHQQGVHVKRINIAPGISGTLVMAEGVSLALLQRLEGGTVTASLINGTTYDLQGAFVMDKIDHDADSGEASFELFGSSCMPR